MSDTTIGGFQYFVIIAEQKKKKKLLSLLGDYDARAIEIVYGRGSMSPSAISEAFGFETRQVKVMISCILKSENAQKIIEVLYKDHRFEEPNTGIAFSIPVEGLVF